MRQTIRAGVIATTFLFALAGIVTTGVAQAGQSVPAITIFVNDRTDFQVRSGGDPDLTVHNLDRIHRVESRINASLPADKKTAREIAMDRIKPHEEALIFAWTGIVRAKAWRIQWLPAIVFGDGEALWYGRDLDAALAAWRAYQANDLNDGPGPQ